MLTYMDFSLHMLSPIVDVHLEYQIKINKYITVHNKICFIKKCLTFKYILQEYIAISWVDERRVKITST